MEYKLDNFFSRKIQHYSGIRARKYTDKKGYITWRMSVSEDIAAKYLLDTVNGFHIYTNDAGDTGLITLPKAGIKVEGKLIKPVMFTTTPAKGMSSTTSVANKLMHWAAAHFVLGDLNQYESILFELDDTGDLITVKIGDKLVTELKED